MSYRHHGPLFFGSRLVPGSSNTDIVTVCITTNTIDKLTLQIINETDLPL